MQNATHQNSKVALIMYIYNTTIPGRNQGKIAPGMGTGFFTTLLLKLCDVEFILIVEV